MGPAAYAGALERSLSRPLFFELPLMSQADPFGIPVPRREFLAGIGALTALGAAGLSGSSQASEEEPAATKLAPGTVVLFQGDSITDAGRSRETAATPNVQTALGGGYAAIAAAGMLVGRPEARLRVYNRGISGHKVFQLSDRWESDCLELSPDVVSVLIGVNDIWHARNGEYDGTVEVYERDYDALLARTRAELPDVRLVVCEPFVLRCGAVDDSWFPEFDAYRAAAQRVASAHAATWVGFQTMFDAALEFAPAEHWAGDGVHPSGAGAALMAQTWRAAVGI